MDGIDGDIFWYFYKSFRFLKTTERAIGTVKDLKKGEDSDGNTEYNPVFQFKTANNEVVIINDNKWSGNKAWSIGDKVMIAYNPDYPKEAKVMTYYRIFGKAMLFLCISIPFVVYGSGYYALERFLK